MHTVLYSTYCILKMYVQYVLLNTCYMYLNLNQELTVKPNILKQYTDNISNADSAWSYHMLHRTTTQAYRSAKVPVPQNCKDLNRLDSLQICKVTDHPGTVPRRSLRLNACTDLRSYMQAGSVQICKVVFKEVGLCSC